MLQRPRLAGIVLALALLAGAATAQPAPPPAPTPAPTPAASPTATPAPRPAAKTTALSKAERKRRIAKLPETYQRWLEDVELLITPEELDAFLDIEQDYQRDAFIERFWEIRDPYPDTARNEARENWEQRLEYARKEYGSLQEDRSRMLLLNGPPDASTQVRCSGVIWPTEVWYYDANERTRQKMYIVFVQHFGLGQYRIWQPAEGLSDLVQYPPPGAGDYQVLQMIAQSCLNADALVGALSMMLRQGALDYSTEFSRLEAPLEKPKREWVATFHAYSTDVDPNVGRFHAKVDVGFPGRRQSRTVVQGIVSVPVAEAGLADFAGNKSYDFLLTGEVLLGRKLFENFRYKFAFPASQITGPEIPLVLERTLRPGKFTMILKVEDLNSGKLFRDQREITVPGVAGPDMPAAVDPETAKLLAEANAAIASGENTIKIIPPTGGDLQAGMVRFDTLTTGAAPTQVDFVLDGKTVLTKRTPPYSVELDLGTLPRTHLLRVVERDAQGQEMASDERQVNAGAHRFAIRFIEPKAGKTYKGSLRAEVAVDTPDNAPVQRVEFYLNETLVATLYQPPFAQPIVLGPNPTGYVRAVAYLPDGNSTERVQFINAPDYLEQVNVQYVELYAATLDKQTRRPIGGLSRQDFSVSEDGKPQEILRFEQVENLPIHVEILLDTSASMADRLDAARQAALRFFQEAVTPKDRAAVVTFNDRPTLQVKLTNDVAALAGALAGLKAERGTSLYDSVIFSLFYLNGIKGQRALLLLTDGKDENSRFTFEECLDYARRAGVAIYAIGLDLGRSEHDAKKKMEKLADETGGESFFIDSVDQLGSIYTQIQKELRSRYLITYQSTNTAPEDKFRSVDLRCSKSGVEVKTIRGYYP